MIELNLAFVVTCDRYMQRYVQVRCVWQRLRRRTAAAADATGRGAALAAPRRGRIAVRITNARNRS